MKYKFLQDILGLQYHPDMGGKYWEAGWKAPSQEIWIFEGKVWQMEGNCPLFLHEKYIMNCRNLTPFP